MRIWVDVPQAAQHELMQVGASAEIVTSQDAAHPTEGKIARTTEAINPRSRTFRVEIDVPNPSRALVPGMYVQVAFSLAARGLLDVPAAALIFRAAGPQVAVVGTDGRIQMRDVVIARDDGKRVLLGSGVAAGDKVALNLSSEISAGDKVAVHERKERLSALTPSREP